MDSSNSSLYAIKDAINIIINNNIRIKSLFIFLNALKFQESKYDYIDNLYAEKNEEEMVTIYHKEGERKI